MAWGNFGAIQWGRAKLNVITGIQGQEFRGYCGKNSPSVIGITVAISKLLEPWITLQTQLHELLSNLKEKIFIFTEILHVLVGVF